MKLGLKEWVSLPLEVVDWCDVKYKDLNEEQDWRILDYSFICDMLWIQLLLLGHWGQ